MVLQEKYITNYQDNQLKILSMCPCLHATLGSKLLVDLLSSSQLDVFQIHTCPEYTQRYPR